MAILPFNLSDLDGSNGFVINGINAGDDSGRSVSSAGDVNGDGLDDLLVGAPNADSNGNLNAGESYVVFGSSEGFTANLDLAALDGSNGFVINGINSNDYSGRPVSSAGDVNGDGLDDLIIGAPNADPNGNDRAGESYVVFGSSEGFTANLDLAALDGSNGFAINGIKAESRSGSSVSSAGDVNGDGLDDLIVGAPDADSNGNSFAGESYVVFGSSEGFTANLDLAALDGSNGFVINGIDFIDVSGSSVSSAGDVNGDGLDDLIIGAPGADRNSNYSVEEGYDNYSVGESYVVFGSSEGFTANLDLAALDGSNGFVINGIEAESRSGSSVSSAGDVNGDGFDDLIIGAPYARPNDIYLAGESYVVFGSSEGFDANLDLAALDGSNGFVINGIKAESRSGSSVSSAGDVNGDGLDDLLIGAPLADRNDNSRVGESYLLFGSSGGFSASLDLGDPDSGNGFVINGIDNYDFSGSSVSSAGDVNGDGLDDLLIGAPLAGPNGYSSAGESYVVFGIPPLELIGTAEDDLLTGSNRDESLSGLGGNDLLRGEAGSDQINGGTGNDLILAGSGNDTVEGQAGSDQINGDTGSDRLSGNGGSDNLFGGEGNDFLSGGTGNDRLLGESGNDTLKGDTGRDIILGSEGNDSLRGGQGFDQILGNAGNDHLSGGSQADTLTGGLANDLLKGEAGNDRLIGVELTAPEDELGAGEMDTLTGGLGSDTFVLGDEMRVYYSDGNPSTTGESDFALITDFDPSQDAIQLQGTAELYNLDFFTSGVGTIDARLIFDPGAAATEELIAILPDVAPELRISAPAFTFA